MSADSTKELVTQALRSVTRWKCWRKRNYYAFNKSLIELPMETTQVLKTKNLQFQIIL